MNCALTEHRKREKCFGRLHFFPSPVLTPSKCLLSVWSHRVTRCSRRKVVARSIAAVARPRSRPRPVASPHSRRRLRATGPIYPPLAIATPTAKCSVPKKSCEGAHRHPHGKRTRPRAALIAPATPSNENTLFCDIKHQIT